MNQEDRLKELQEIPEDDEDTALVICRELDKAPMDQFGNEPTTCYVCEQDIAISKKGRELSGFKKKVYVCIKCTLKISPGVHAEAVLGLDEFVDKLPPSSREDYKRYVAKLLEMPISELGLED